MSNCSNVTAIWTMCGEGDVCVKMMGGKHFVNIVFGCEKQRQPNAAACGDCKDV